MIVHEEILEFFYPFGREVLQLSHVSVHVIGLSDCDKSIVTNLLFAIELFALDNSDQLSAYGASWESRLIGSPNLPFRAWF